MQASRPPQVTGSRLALKALTLPAHLTWELSALLACAPGGGENLPEVTMQSHTEKGGSHTLRLQT